MKINTLPPLKVLLLSIISIFQFSCSKDSDLLADLVIADTSQAILIDDIFVVSLNSSTVLDVLSNDIINEEENVTITETSEPNNGTVEINPDNTITYTPETTEETEDTFTYTTEVVDSDDSVTTETGNVTVNISSSHDPSKESGSIFWNTDFETVQWSSNGSASNGKWETERDSEVRVTNDSRAGNKAIWLGDFNGGDTRNEIKSNRLLDWGEHWIGFSLKITEELPKSRTYIQFRNTRESGGVGAGVINPVTLRQGDPGQLYFQTSTIAGNVNKIYTTGASTGTERHNFNYNSNDYVDIVIHWVLHPTNGYIEIWANGDKIVDETGTTTYRYAHVDGEPYDGDVGVQMGLYWSKSNNPQGNAFYDEFTVWKGGGGSYQDVFPD